MEKSRICGDLLENEQGTPVRVVVAAAVVVLLLLFLPKIGHHTFKHPPELLAVRRQGKGMAPSYPLSKVAPQRYGGHGVWHQKSSLDPGLDLAGTLKTEAIKI